MPVPSIVQIGSAIPSGSVSSVNIVVPTGGVPAGYTILVFIQSASPVTSVTDSQSNKYVKDFSYNSASNGLLLQVYRCSNNVPLYGDNAITVLTGLSSTTLIAIATYYTSFSFTQPPLDVSIAASGQGVTAASGSTPTVFGGNELVIGVVGAYNNTPGGVVSITPGTGYTLSTQVAATNPQQLILATESQYFPAASGVESITGGSLPVGSYWMAAALVYLASSGGVSGQGFPGPPAPGSLVFLPGTPTMYTPLPVINPHTSRKT